MFEAFGNHAEGESLDTRDGLITIGTVAHETPASVGTSASHRPSSSRSSSMDKVHLMYCSIRASSLTTKWSRRGRRSCATMSPRRATHLER